MSFANPTSIRPGMAATFLGKTYRVTGRAVLGVVEEGRKYYWNEYYLETAGNEWATLVFDQSEHGQWRLFTLFEPDFPITAADAATKVQGDPLNLDGTQVFVTLVDTSTVYYTEGRTIEGVEVGSIARYFNAETGPKMIVVSWTGDEVECYDGTAMSARMVADAFGLQGAALLKFALTGGRNVFGAAVLVPAALIFLAFVIIPMGIWSTAIRAGRPPAVMVLKATPPPLPSDASGVLNGTNYRITGHTLMEIAQVDRRVQRHDYSLRDDDGNAALLARDATPDAKAWLLFTPMQPQTPLTPPQAGNICVGQTVWVDGIAARVTELFRCTVRQTDNTDSLALRAGDVLYGFGGPFGSNHLMVRWNQSNITYYRGTLHPAQTVQAAFTQPPAR